MSQSTFNLPDLGEGLTEAELTRWLVSEGDQIVVDQPIAEVETAKALVEVPSPYAGTVATLHGAEGQTMIVGEPLITVSTAVPVDQGSGPEGVAGVPDDGPSPGALSYREEERAGMEIPAADGAETTPDLDRVRGGDAGGGAAERAAETGEATRTAPDRGEGTAASDPETEGSGSVLIGYGTSGHGAGGRTRPKRQRPRWTESATSAAAPATLARVRDSPVHPPLSPAHPQTRARLGRRAWSHRSCAAWPRISAWTSPPCGAPARTG